MPEPVLTPARHESSDITALSALIAFPAILVGLLLAVLLVRWIYPDTAADRRLPTGVPEFPLPRLQANPQADMQAFLKQELFRLNSAGWDDQSKGIGHIAIDDAMRRVAASGIADWPQ